MRAGVARSLWVVLATGGLIWGCDAVLGIGAPVASSGSGGGGTGGLAGAGGKTTTTTGTGGTDACGGPCTTPPTECFEVPGVCASTQCAYALAAAGKGCSAGGKCDGKGNCVPPSDGGPDGGSCTGTCTAPPTDCYLTNGFCVGTTCDYTFLSEGSACNGGTCDGAGMCRPCGGPCETPPACHTNPGSCNQGACTYPDAAQGTPCAGGACNANGGCMQGTSSSSGGGCNGCTSPPAECYASPGTCNGAQCTYGFSGKDTPCSGGLCNGNGMCTPVRRPVHHAAPVLRQRRLLFEEHHDVQLPVRAGGHDVHCRDGGGRVQRRGAVHVLRALQQPAPVPRRRHLLGDDVQLPGRERIVALVPRRDVLQRDVHARHRLVQRRRVLDLLDLLVVHRVVVVFELGGRLRGSRLPLHDDHRRHVLLRILWRHELSVRGRPEQVPHQ